MSAARPPTRPVAGSVTDDDRRRRQTTDAIEQNNTGPLGGPVIIGYNMQLATTVTEAEHFAVMLVESRLTLRYRNSIQYMRFRAVALRVSFAADG